MATATGGALSFFVIVSNKCSIRCRYCFYGQGLLKKKRLTRMLSPVLLATSLRNLGASNVVLTGGDPLHLESFDFSLSLAKELLAAGISVSANTALVISDRKKLDALMPSFSALYVSCDSHDPTVNDRQRGKGAIVLAGIKHLASLGANIHVNSVVTRFNYRQIKRTYGHLTDIGAQAVDFNIATLPEGTLEREVLSCELLPARDKHKLLDDLLWIADRSGDPATRRRYALYQAELFLGSAIKERPICVMGSKILVADVAGQVRPCFHREESWGDIEEIGSIRRKVECRTMKPFSCRSKSCASLFAINAFWQPRKQTERR